MIPARRSGVIRLRLRGRASLHGPYWLPDRGMSSGLREFGANKPVVLYSCLIQRNDTFSFLVTRILWMAVSYGKPGAFAEGRDEERPVQVLARSALFVEKLSN